MDNYFYALAFADKLESIEIEAWRKTTELANVHKKEIVILTERSLPAIFNRIDESKKVIKIKTQRIPRTRDIEVLRNSIVFIDNVTELTFNLYKANIRFGVYVSYTDSSKYANWISDFDAKLLTV